MKLWFNENIVAPESWHLIDVRANMSTSLPCVLILFVSVEKWEIFIVFLFLFVYFFDDFEPQNSKNSNPKSREVL